ncbi:hypothetical protein NDU88_000117 [Pleurodeles waltl]|uniref:Uncharacterized protein n=1 Tax=Pleurodeles waltl TaxID=8319 RepID=A0AAV7TEM2_PLEWA|nr:hypothetical protein NDU88_000117 [Pleurodeles waltl]
MVSAHQKKDIWCAIDKDVRTLGVYHRRSTHCRKRWEDIRRWSKRTAEAQLGMASQRGRGACRTMTSLLFRILVVAYPELDGRLRASQQPQGGPNLAPQPQHLRDQWCLSSPDSGVHQAAGQPVWQGATARTVPHLSSNKICLVPGGRGKDSSHQSRSQGYRWEFGVSCDTFQSGEGAQETQQVWEEQHGGEDCHQPRCPGGHRHQPRCPGGHRHQPRCPGGHCHQPRCSGGHRRQPRWARKDCQHQPRWARQDRQHQPRWARQDRQHQPQLGLKGPPATASLGLKGPPAPAPLGQTGPPAPALLGLKGPPAPAPLGQTGPPAAAPLGQTGPPAPAPLAQKGPPAAESMGQKGPPAAESLPRTPPQPAPLNMTPPPQAPLNRTPPPQAPLNRTPLPQAPLARERQGH